MQIIAILILVAIVLLVFGGFLYELAKDLVSNFWGIVGGILGVIALLSGIICLLCLCLYAVGAGSPGLTRGFVPCVLVFLVSLGGCLLLAKSHS